jgi:hypothetical protein
MKSLRSCGVAIPFKLLGRRATPGGDTPTLPPKKDYEMPPVPCCIQNSNSGGQFATANVLDSLWNYMAGTICPIAAGLAIVGAIWNFVTRRPLMPMVGATLGLLTVSALWKLVIAMM